MIKRVGLLLCMAVLILDSRCAAEAAGGALELCIRTLIPGLFPMFVLSAMLLPSLSGLHIPGLARLLGIPAGSEGILVLGCAGGFPVGAACIVQAAESGGLRREDAGRMLGLFSFCGPAFLFGIIGNLFSLREAGLLFLIQLETALVMGCLWPCTAAGAMTARKMESVSLPAALKRAVSSLSSVCAWVTLASVAAGFLRRWLAPFLPDGAAVVLSGILELTTGVNALGCIGPEELRFVLCSGFVCFGGISVLLQIGGLAAGAGIGMKQCIAQKAFQGILGAVIGAGTVCFGPIFLSAPLLVPLGKIAVEISGRLVYNGRRKEGI